MSRAVSFFEDRAARGTPSASVISSTSLNIGSTTRSPVANHAFLAGTVLIMLLRSRQAAVAASAAGQPGLATATADVFSGRKIVAGTMAIEVTGS